MLLVNDVGEYKKTVNYIYEKIKIKNKWNEMINKQLLRLIS